MLRRRNIAFYFGIIVFLLIVFSAIIGPFVYHVDPLRGNLTNRLVAPLSPGFPMGTDANGRDILSRLLQGIRISLFISVSGVLLSTIVGVGIGLISGFVGGWVSNLLMRLADIQLAFPFLVLALLVLTAVPPSVSTLIMLMVLASWVMYARTVRSSVLKEVNREYVQSATVLGASRLRIAMRYVLPNLIPTIAAISMLDLAAMILFEATLSYLGVGIQPPTPSIGGMMLEGQIYMRSAWWVTTLPGLSLFLTTLSLNMIIEGLRNILDPRLQR